MKPRLQNLYWFSTCFRSASIICRPDVIRFSSSSSTLPPHLLELANGVLAGSRTHLSRAITLVESAKPQHISEGSQLLSYIHERTEEKSLSTFRIGISGPPGVGKSTFIDVLGCHIAKQKGLSVAVLAIDPSSSRSGGSILGDKTRMEELTKLSNTYVRPSPNRGTLGGVCRSTSDSISLCEACGYDVTLVETVGVGQSEIAVEAITDMFVLLVPPAGGDELQGIKKGVMEWVDYLIVNKADGELATLAKKTASDYRSALHLSVPKSQLWQPVVKCYSSLSGNNINDIWAVMEQYWKVKKDAGELYVRRAEQRVQNMWKIIEDHLMLGFQSNEAVKSSLPSVESQVSQNLITPGTAADRLIDMYRTKATQS